jgi:hypothetical protein
MLKSIRTRIAKAISPVQSRPVYPILQAPKTYAPLSRKEMMGERGRSGLRRFYPGWIREEKLTDLQGAKLYQTLEEMGDMNAYCAACLNAFSMFLRRSRWSVDPVVDENKENGSAQFLEECMKDMEHSWQTFIAIASRFIPQYGFCPFEIVYKIRNGDNEDERYASLYDDARIGWQNFAIRAPSTVLHWVWYPDDPNRLRGLVQLTPPDYPADLFIPKEKLLLLRAEPGKDNPEGRSVLRSSYKPYVIIKYAEDIRNVIMERGGSGIPCADVPAAISNPYKVDPTTGDAVLDDDGNPVVDPVALATLTSIQNTLENLRQGDQPWVIRPVDYQTDSQGNPTANKLFDITFLTNNGGSMLGEISNIVKDEGMKILMSTMSEFLALGTNATGGGSFALSRDKTDNFSLAITAYLDAIEESINNQAVRRLFKLNPEFDNLETLPRIVHDPIIPININEVSAVLSGFKGMGWDLTKEANAEEIKNAILDAVGLPKAAKRNEANDAGEIRQETNGEEVGATPESSQKETEDLKIPVVPDQKPVPEAKPLEKWDESDHPRAESGSAAGQFVSRGDSSSGGSRASSPTKYRGLGFDYPTKHDEGFSPEDQELIDAVNRSGEKVRELPSEVRQVIKRYSQESHADINRLLCDTAESSAYSPEKKAQIQEKIDVLDSAFEKLSLDEPVTAYRGVSSKILNDAPDLKEALMMVGTEVSFKGFSSSSIRSDIAFEFTDKESVLFELQLPKGTKAAYIAKESDFETEMELLIARGTRFRVKSEARPESINRMHFDPEKRTVITLEAIVE